MPEGETVVVGVGVEVGDGDGVAVLVSVGVEVAVADGVAVPVGVRVNVAVGVSVSVGGIMVGSSVAVGVTVAVAVAERVGVGVNWSTPAAPYSDQLPSTSLALQTAYTSLSGATARATSRMPSRSLATVSGSDQPAAPRRAMAIEEPASQATYTSSPGEMAMLGSNARSPTDTVSVRDQTPGIPCVYGTASTPPSDSCSQTTCAAPFESQTISGIRESPVPSESISGASHESPSHRLANTSA